MKKIVGVKHTNQITDKVYFFFTDLELNLGDTVVVDTTQGSQVAKVVQLNTNINVKPVKWVIGKVDTNAHELRLRTLGEVEHAIARRTKEIIQNDWKLEVLNHFLDELK